MAAATRRTAMVVLLLGLAIGPWGCAHHLVPRGPVPPSDDLRAELGTIGVPVASLAPQAEIIAPTRGKGAGALAGAGRGLMAGATPGLFVAGATAGGCHGVGGDAGTACAFVIMAGLGAAVAGGTVGALGGTVYGVFAAESAATIAAAENALTRAVDELDLQRTLRDQVVEIARERSSLLVAELDESGDEDGIDTVLDVRISRVRLAGGGGVKPRVGVALTAEARLIRTEDGAELYAETFEYHGAPEHTVTGWAADDAAAFRQELDSAVRRVADDVARVLFPGDAIRDEPAPALLDATEAEPTP